MNFVPENYTILGFGKSAEAALDFLLQSAKQITVYDSKARESFDSNLLADYEKQGVKFDLGSPSLQGTRRSLGEGGSDNIFIVSPGIPPSSRLIQDLKKANAQFKTDLDLFIEALAKDQNYLAITGTNGKTTTTSLIAHIFNTEAIGNIGKPFLEYKEVSEPYVCEISSFQIFYSQLKRLPEVAVHLNLTPDHLDWHSSLDEYKDTKARLFDAKLDEKRFLVLNYDDPASYQLGQSILAKLKPDDKTKVLFFSTQTILHDLSNKAPFAAYLKDSKLYLAVLIEEAREPDPNLVGMISSNAHGDYILEVPVIDVNELKIVGEHNYSNALAAILTGFSQKIYPEELAEKLASFTPVPHRLEFVTEVEGHKVYNDSKATNPDSSIKALLAFDKPIMILGGKDKYLDLSEFLQLVAKQAFAVVAIGELAASIKQQLNDLAFNKVAIAESLEAAFKQALDFGKGNAYPIALSPASSSFDMFKNYEDRGEQFKKIAIQCTKCSR